MLIGEIATNVTALDPVCEQVGSTSSPPIIGRHTLHDRSLTASSSAGTPLFHCGVSRYDETIRSHAQDMECSCPLEVAKPIQDLAELGEFIHRRRVELSLSQTDLAEQIGTTRQWVSRLEKGKNDIGTARLLAVLDALELNLEIGPPRLVSAAGLASQTPWIRSLIGSDTGGALIQMRKEPTALSAGWTTGLSTQLSAGLSALTESVDPGDLEARRRRRREASLKLSQGSADANANTNPDDVEPRRVPVRCPRRRA